MARFDPWEAGAYALESDAIIQIEFQHRERRDTVWQIQNYLVNAAIDNGDTALVAGERVDELFGAHGGSWSIYVLTGANQIVTDIDTDTTIGWLDFEYPAGGGKTIRERVITQLEKTVD